MKSEAYWSKRFEALSEAQLNKGEKYIETLNREYAKATAEIQKDIEVFYQRFAKNNEVSYAEARQMLTAGQLKEFRWTVQEYIQKGRENAVDQRWMKELENASIKVRVSRLEALQTQMRAKVEMLAAKRQTGTQDVLGGIYKDGYYRSVFELQKGAGVGTSFAKLDSRQTENLLMTPWAPDGKNFSARIWGDRTKLVTELQTTLVQGLIRGDPAEKMISGLSDRMGVSRANAARLVMTEAAYFSGQSRLDAYREMEVEEYKFTATLDRKTSPMCQGMDGKVFPISEAKAGVNYPPLHSHCRSTTIPHYDDNVKERAAREDGKTYDVPGDMTYEQWKKEHVDAPKLPKNDIIEPEKQFKAILDETPNMTPEYKAVLEGRFSSGSEDAKRVYLKYVKGNAVNETSNSAAHYTPVDQVINMHFGDDLKNPRGAGATYFHEYGHYVDNMAAIEAVGHQTYDGVSHIAIGDVAGNDFRKAILDDVHSYIMNYAKKRDIDIRQAQKEISEILGTGDGALHSAVSDIYGGATHRMVQGKYGHPPAYWRQLPNAVEKEAFAHMFEASFDPSGKRLSLIKEFLPTAFEVFKKILEEI
ncbi:minor capsid protein [Paenibacillus oleatilyticus]|uniref:Minor capsid protein n=1 Tax=Paenibacillus oleatilyticus TaxID=2594886 RepID=A0ABV4UX13_9BACL